MANSDETVIPPWGNFDQRIANIDPEAAIWRYMDIAKFLDLFVKRRLHFQRCDLFPDSFEGMPTVPQLKYQYSRFRGLHEEIPGVLKDPEKSADRTFLKLRERNFINCWYFGGPGAMDKPGIGWQESAAMWSLYSKNGGGVAIQTTIKSLRAALCRKPDDDYIYIGKVIYVDYNTHDFDSRDYDLRGLFFLKRNHFDHEREIRALYSIPKGNPDKTGHYICNLDLSQMIQAVVLAPDTPPWSRESIEAIVQEACPGVRVLPSALKSEPPIKFV